MFGHSRKKVNAIDVDESKRGWLKSCLEAHCRLKKHRGSLVVTLTNAETNDSAQSLIMHTQHVLYLFGISTQSLHLHCYLAFI